MKIEHFIDISQTVEFNITADDLTVIMEEPWNDEEETKQQIMCNLNTCLTYMKGLPASAIKKLHVDARRIIMRNLKPIFEKFENLDCADHVLGQRCDCSGCIEAKRD